MEKHSIYSQIHQKRIEFIVFIECIQQKINILNLINTFKSLNYKFVHVFTNLK